MTDRRVSADQTIRSDLAEVHRIQADVEAALQANEFGDTDLFAVKLAVEEALVNAIKHGNQLDANKTVRVVYTVDHERFDIAITDEGVGFNPADLPDPTDEDHIDKPCGRGVLIIRNFMTHVEYVGRGNHVVMSKVKTPPEE